MKRVLVLCLCLAGCSTSWTAPREDSFLRDRAAPIASQSDASLQRLQGRWVVVEGAGLAQGGAVTINNNSIIIENGTFDIRDQGQGRLMIDDADVWVHWIDIDSRTAALGAPDGSRVWIMDRTGRPGERLSAARKILDWYGYDLSRLNSR